MIVALWLYLYNFFLCLKIHAEIFTDESIVNLDYKTSVKSFTIVNKYISEGKFYVKHEWNVID